MVESAFLLLISGRVQGVGYRQWTVRKAESMGLKGWVRNLLDGRVEAHIQGEEETVRKFIEVCHEGPPHSQVNDIEISTAQIDPALMGIEIKR